MNTLAPSRRQMLVGAAVVAAASTSTFQPAVASPGGATVTQIRNATLRIDYAGVRFLVDPMLADQGAFPGFPGTAMSHLRNPLVPLPTSLPELLAVDAVVVTHTHPDHWDEAAQALVPKGLPIFVQNDSDAAVIRGQGFSDVRVLTDATAFRGVRLTKTAGQHGPDAVVRALPELLGEVCGVVLSHPGEKTLYLAGDTVWNGAVDQAIASHRPEVIVLNAGFAQILDLGPIIMGRQDVLAVHRAAPDAQIIATHMEAVNHCTLSRADLRAFSQEQGFADRLLIPADGERLTL